jgi:hypothetical protein
MTKSQLIQPMREMGISDNKIIFEFNQKQNKLVGKTKCSPEQIRTAVSRFLFSFVIEIQSLKSLAQQAYLGDWPLDSAPYSLVKLKNMIRPGFVHACMYVYTFGAAFSSFFRSFILPLSEG